MLEGYGGLERVDLYLPNHNLKNCKLLYVSVCMCQ